MLNIFFTESSSTCQATKPTTVDQAQALWKKSHFDQSIPVSRLKFKKDLPPHIERRDSSPPLLVVKMEPTENLDVLHLPPPNPPPPIPERRVSDSRRNSSPILMVKLEQRENRDVLHISANEARRRNGLPPCKCSVVF